MTGESNRKDLALVVLVVIFFGTAFGMLKYYNEKTQVVEELGKKLYSYIKT